MAALYRGQELSLQELFSAFSYKLEEILTDPDKYVTQPAFTEPVVHIHDCRFSKIEVDEVRTP
jgi:hypothetical protein